MGVFLKQKLARVQRQHILVMAKMVRLEMIKVIEDLIRKEKEDETGIGNYNQLGALRNTEDGGRYL